jgi:hypothetical protein
MSSFLLVMAGVYLPTGWRVKNNALMFIAVCCVMRVVSLSL